ncbi:Pro-apoptotic serine protease NMA111 [Frankliniella fusca]|uniref:Pro-apoptotic serine protease NMA111 n=1 Tax=Frankliniella fusca TaxID=407009 RepID=A0AAE1LHD4_9NEOP|nr:Pro-apoptotic serine protease NMA111 [Frankliniella fusca]
MAATTFQFSRTALLAMLLPALLASAALLPLALAACPCPPAPAAAEVCGSDHKTYPSACDLTCTAPTVLDTFRPDRRRACTPAGVTAAHPGPCRPAEDSVLAPELNDSLTTGGRARRSPKEPVTLEQYTGCCSRKSGYLCGHENYGNQEVSSLFAAKQECSCLGFPSEEYQGIVYNFEQWDRCKKLTCYDAGQSCWQSCRHGSRKFQDCRNTCYLQGLRCGCECLVMIFEQQDTSEEAEEAAPLVRSSSLDPDEEVSLTAAAPRPAAPAAPAVLLAAAALLTAW